jgi:Ca-activated chloride channel family protein
MSPKLDPEKDYYQILGLPPTAEMADIRAAHRRLARKYHPDGGKGDVEAFRAAQEAYEVLSNTALRRAYDRQRLSRGLTPDAPVKLEVTTNRLKLPTSELAQRLYVMLDLQTTNQAAGENQRLNLALVVDCSNSMQGRRMQNVKIATQELIDSLSEDARLALVKFNDRAEVLVPSSLVEEGGHLRSAVARLRAEGGTEIYQGLLAGLREVRRYAGPQYLNHVILVTDGHTYGDEELALREVRLAASESIGVSAMGIGEDWNDLFLDRLARDGQGVSDYVSSPSHLRSVLHQQVQILHEVCLRDVRMYVNHAPYVELQAAARVLPHMEDLTIHKGDVISLANLGEEPTTLFLELSIKQPNIGEYRLARLNLEATVVPGDEAVHLQRDIVVDFVADGAESVGDSVPTRLLSLLSRLVVFRLQERAWRALDEGDQKRATHLLESAATRLFDMGHRNLARAAMLEVQRVSQGGEASSQGRKAVRYGTRSLSMRSSS